MDNNGSVAPLVLRSRSLCIIQRVDGEGEGGSGGYLPSSGQVGAVGIRERVGEGSDLIVPDGNFCSVSRIISFYHIQPLSIY